MDTISVIESKKFLGQEFLAWLWINSVNNNGIFSLSSSEDKVEVWLDSNLTLKLENDREMEQVACRGSEYSEMHEAKEALKRGKKISSARFRVIFSDGTLYQVTLDSTFLNLKSLKTPKTSAENADDLDGVFLEKMLLVNKIISALDTLFLQYVNSRLGGK